MAKKRKKRPLPLKVKPFKKVRVKKAQMKKKVIPVTVAKNQEEIPLKKTKIRVFGIGGGASSIISEIAPRVKKASFVAVDADKKALKEVKKSVMRFQFGEELAHGLGTGMNVEMAEMAALAEKDRIKKLFEGQDLCVFVACLGGGTGSGATKVFVKMAKSAGCLTYGILTLPFNFEGEKKAVIAKEALGDLRQKLHAFSVIPNERIFHVIQKETPLRQALSAINTRLASSLEGLIEIIYEPGLINIDFADLKVILNGQGRLTYLNCVQVHKKEGAVQEEVDKLLNSQLYPYGIKGARNVLYNIAGESGLTLAEVSQISRNISDLANKDAKIIFGISQSQKYGGTIKTTLLATGCQAKIFSQELSPQVKEKHLVKAKTGDSGPKKKKSPPSPGKVKLSQKAGKRHSKRSNAKASKKTKKPILGKSKKKKKPKSIARKTKPVKSEKKKKRAIRVKVVGQNNNENIQEMTTPMFPGTKAEAKVRKNALQIKADVQKEEDEILAREKMWETPAFLRRKK